MAYFTPLDDAKVSYVTRDGYESKAYINTGTGQGTDKHTDIAIEVEWSDEMEKWYQIDNRQWQFNVYRGDFIEITEDDELDPVLESKKLRRQPRNLSKKKRQRRKK